VLSWQGRGRGSICGFGGEGVVRGKREARRKKRGVGGFMVDW